MDYETYDNDTNPSDDGCSEFVRWLSQHMASELREVKGESDKEKQALCRYYGRGLRANLTLPELIDFLGVSAPSLLDRVGYSDKEGDDLMRISDGLTEEDGAAALPQRG